MEQLLLLAAEFADATLVALGFATSDLGVGLDVTAESLADGGLLGGGEQQGLVLVLDSALDLVQPDIGSFAAPRLGDPAEAGVVLVVLARATAVTPASKALAADPAEQRTGQIVGVLMRAVAAGAMRVQNALGLIEGLPVDDRFMASGALDALTGDDADVVVVSEHTMNHAARERGARSLRSTSCTQSGLFQDFRDRREGVRAGCGEVEGQLRTALADAVDLLVIESPTDSDSWRETGERLQTECSGVSWAVYCLSEWAEPDDSEADIVPTGTEGGAVTDGGEARAPLIGTCATHPPEVRRSRRGFPRKLGA